MKPLPCSVVASTLEAWLWRRGFHHLQIRVIMRNLLLFGGFFLLIGLLAVPFFVQPLTFAVGSLVFVNIFWGIARHILSITLTAYSMNLLMFMFVRTALRLAITAIVLYVVLVVYHASAIALVDGIIVSLAVALGTFALVGFAGHKQ